MDYRKSTNEFLNKFKRLILFCLTNRRRILMWKERPHSSAPIATCYSHIQSNCQHLAGHCCSCCPPQAAWASNQTHVLVSLFLHLKCPSQSPISQWTDSLWCRGIASGFCARLMLALTNQPSEHGLQTTRGVHVWMLGDVVFQAQHFYYRAAHQGEENALQVHYRKGK